ncbi:hypothetical protein As57867_007158, partial [Aphanomyces stellatus]
TLWGEIERVVLPPSKTKTKTRVVSPGGAIFLEQLVLQCVGQAESQRALVVDRLWQHAHLILTCTDPLIRGNLQVQGMAYENAVFLVDTLVTGLLHLDDTARLCDLLGNHHHVLSLVASPVLRGLCHMPLHAAQVELVQSMSVQAAWLPEVVELVATWMHGFEASSTPAGLATVLFEWTLFPSQTTIVVAATDASKVDMAVASQALKYAGQLYQRAAAANAPLDALRVLGGLLALRRHTVLDIRAASAQTIKQCLLETTSGAGLFPPTTWLWILRAGLGPYPPDDATISDSDEWTALMALQKHNPTTTPSSLALVQVLAQVLLHHLDDLVGCPTFDQLWTELLQALDVHLKAGQEEALELLRNVLHIVRISCEKEAWFAPSVQTLATQYPDLDAPQSVDPPPIATVEP